MAKTKTLKKREAFSLNEMKTAKLKDGIESVPHNPKMNLSDIEFIARALADCIVDGDEKAFKEILHSHYKVMNVREAADLAGIGKSTFAEVFKPKGNPRLSTIFSLFKGLGDVPRPRRRRA